MSALEGPTAAIRGRILLGDDREAEEIWVRGGRVSLTRPSAQGTNMQILEGWACPAWSTCTATSGSPPTAPSRWRRPRSRRWRTVTPECC